MVYLHAVVPGVLGNGSVREVFGKSACRLLAKALVEKGVLALEKVSPKAVRVKEMAAEHGNAGPKGACDVPAHAPRIPLAHGSHKRVDVGVENGVSDLVAT